MNVLILGGTSESRLLAARLSQDSRFDTLTSLAGRVSDPQLPEGDSRVGGFGGADGLATWIHSHAIEVVVDATHPFAATMSGNAAMAATSVGVPLLRLNRPEWTAGAGDVWLDASTPADAARMVESFSERAFLTIGRLGVWAFAGNSRTWFLIRSIDAPVDELPSRHELVLARGPFDIDDEIATMREHRIDVVVSKNSGGAMTEGKLVAARRLGIPVVMIARPPASPSDHVTDSVDGAVAWLRSRL